MKKVLFLTFVFALIFGVANATSAQSEISAEKREQIAELIEVSKIKQQMAKVTDDILKNVEDSYPTVVTGTLANYPNLSSKQKSEIAAQLASKQKAFSRKFRERLPKTIDYNQYVEEAIYPLYDKFFTVDELKDINAFYKTATGAKMIETMPALFAESLKMSQEILMPKVIKLIDEIIQEDINNLSEPPPPKAKSK